jgi:predicted RNase H-like HicB family nuclease
VSRRDRPMCDYLEARPHMKQIKIIVEKHPDGYVAYPLGVKGVVVGQGDTFEAALADVASAIRFHVETFGADMLDTDPPVLDAFIAEAGVAV